MLPMTTALSETVGKLVRIELGEAVLGLDVMPSVGWGLGEGVGCDERLGDLASVGASVALVGNGEGATVGRVDKSVGARERT